MASIEQVKAALAQAAKQSNATTTLQSSSQAAPVHQRPGLTVSVGDVKADLRDGNQSLDQAKTTIEGIGAALAEVRSLALATLHDSQHPEAKRPAAPSPKQHAK